MKVDRTRRPPEKKNAISSMVPVQTSARKYLGLAAAHYRRITIPPNFLRRFLDIKIIRRDKIRPL